MFIEFFLLLIEHLIEHKGKSIIGGCILLDCKNCIRVTLSIAVFRLITLLGASG
jgi:hypothetical protein